MNSIPLQMNLFQWIARLLDVCEIKSNVTVPEDGIKIRTKMATLTTTLIRDTLNFVLLSAVWLAYWIEIHWESENPLCFCHPTPPIQTVFKTQTFTCPSLVDNFFANFLGCKWLFIDYIIQPIGKRFLFRLQLTQAIWLTWWWCWWLNVGYDVLKIISGGSIVICRMILTAGWIEFIELDICTLLIFYQTINVMLCTTIWRSYFKYVCYA